MFASSSHLCWIPLVILVEVTVVFNGGYYKSQRQNRPVTGLPLIFSNNQNKP